MYQFFCIKIVMPSIVEKLVRCFQSALIGTGSFLRSQTLTDWYQPTQNLTRFLFRNATLVSFINSQSQVKTPLPPTWNSIPTYPPIQTASWNKHPPLHCPSPPTFPLFIPHQVESFNIVFSCTLPLLKVPVVTEFFSFLFFSSVCLCPKEAFLR